MVAERLVIFMIMWMSFALAVITDPLEPFCDNENDRYVWEDVPIEEWYWHANYSDVIAQGNENTTIYPAGFRPYILYQFNEPPICITVPESGDKKVEILIQSEVEDTRICIHDASDIGFANNDVGNVDTCGMGKIYACFTAAETENGETYDDFSFYVYCKESCETDDVDLWLRVRTSEQTWEVGKTGVGDDLEMWCEMEKGTLVNDSSTEDHYYFTYPEDLIQDDPSVWPFVIEQITQGDTEEPSSKHNSAAMVAVAVFAILFILIAGLCVCKNHDQLPEGCQRFVPCADAPIDDYE